MKNYTGPPKIHGARPWHFLDFTLKFVHFIVSIFGENQDFLGRNSVFLKSVYFKSLGAMYFPKAVANPTRSWKYKYGSSRQYKRDFRLIHFD